MRHQLLYVIASKYTPFHNSASTILLQIALMYWNPVQDVLTMLQITMLQRLGKVRLSGYPEVEMALTTPQLT